MSENRLIKGKQQDLMINTERRKLILVYSVIITQPLFSETIKQSKFLKPFL